MLKELLDSLCVSKCLFDVCNAVLNMSDYHIFIGLDVVIRKISILVIDDIHVNLFKKLWAFENIAFIKESELSFLWIWGFEKESFSRN